MSAYPAAFEAAWAATAKTGSKFKALKAWKAHGQPGPDVVGAAWAKWSRLDGWRRGFVPHVSTWLNGRCFEQEPVDVPRAKAPPDSRCAFHRAYGTLGKLPVSGAVFGCPECKHASAARGARQGEPSPVVDALPKWAGEPATAEQLAQLRGNRG